MSARTGGDMSAADSALPVTDLGALRARAADLRQAATLPQAEPQLLLSAALAELDGAVAALDEVNGSGAATGSDGKALSGLHSDRRLLQAIFASIPVPLYVIDHDGTVLRANAAAADALGVGPGYTSGRSLAALVEPTARAALRSQVAAAVRTGTSTRVDCGMLVGDGVVRCQLEVRPLSVRGDADRLLVTVTPAVQARMPASADRTTVEAADVRPVAAADADTDATAVAGAARRLDLLAAAARLLLESSSVSDSVVVQRCAHLLSGTLATWAIVDVHRRGQLRRRHVAGPDDPGSTALTQALATADPSPGTVPDQVFESCQVLVVTHADDETALGESADGRPLLTLVGGASLLAVPMTDGSHPIGVLTLIRRAADGQFGLAEAALAQEVGVLLGLAIATRRMLRRRTETADALRASLLPPVLKPVPGVEIASAHLPPTRGREVGGDFYDVYPTPGGWGVAIGDVCGKGEDAAAATAAARHAIRVLAHSTADPATVLRGANEIMLAEEFGGRFVTASAAHLSWRDGRLLIVLATAGHPPPVVIRADGLTERVKGGGLPLGIFPDPEPATVEIELSDKDVLFCYTDGLADARGPQPGNLDEQLSDRLAELAGHRAADIVSEMRTMVLDFTEGVLRDDLTMLVLRAGTAP